MIVNNPCRFGRLCIFFQPYLSEHHSAKLISAPPYSNIKDNLPTLTGFSLTLACHGASRSWKRASSHIMQISVQSVFVIFWKHVLIIHLRKKLMPLQFLFISFLLVNFYNNNQGLLCVVVKKKYVEVKCLTIPLSVPNSPSNYFCQQSLYPSQKSQKEVWVVVRKYVKVK